MITLNDALDILRNSVHKAGAESVLLSLSLGRILAEDIITVSDFPPFNKSAADGFACRRDDLDKALTISGEVKAGESPTFKIEPGQCIKIKDGAMLPEGADCVISFEHTAEDSSGKLLVTSKPNTDNIHYLGEEKKKGEVVLKQGILIRNKHIGILAANGVHSVSVYKQPLISVYSVGKELVEAEDIPEEAQIRNSNGPQLIMQLQSIGINAMYGGIIDDDQAILEIEITRSIEHSNGIIFSGGISGGVSDLVPETLKKMGFKILFYKLKVYPWNYLLFAVQGDKFCFGLSGNPLSSFMQLELLVKPFIFQLMGHQYIPESVYLESGEDFIRKKTDLESVIPVKRDDSNKIVKVYNNNSGNIFSLSEMYGILLFPERTEIIKKGEMTKVILL